MATYKLIIVWITGDGDVAQGFKCDAPTEELASAEVMRQVTARADRLRCPFRVVKPEDLYGLTREQIESVKRDWDGYGMSQSATYPYP
jgi:hypothetical protein